MKFFRFNYYKYIKNDSLKDIIKLTMNHKDKLIKVGFLTIASSSMFMILPMAFKEIQILSKLDPNLDINEMKNKYYIFSGKVVAYLLLLGYISRKRLIKNKEFEDSILMDLRRKLFMSKVLKMGEVYKSSTYANSSLITKNINDAYNITFSLSDTYFRLIRGLTFGLGGISIMVYSFPSLFMFTICGSLFLTVLNKNMNKKILTYSNLQIKKLSEKSSFMGSIYNKSKVVESNLLYNFSYTFYNKLLLENHKLTMNLTKQRANYIMYLELFGISFFMGIITYGTFLISLGKIPSESLSLSLYSIYGISGLRGILYSIADIKEKIGVYDDLVPLIKENNINNYDKYNKENISNLILSLNKFLLNSKKNDIKIEYENLMNQESKEYEILDKELKKLQNNISLIKFDVNYDIEKDTKYIKFEANNNEKIGIVGKSGIGKSSFFDIIKNLYNFKNQKNIEYYNEKNEKLKEDNLNIFYCFQNDMLMHLSIIENIILGNFNFINKLLKISQEKNISEEIIVKYIIKKVLLSLKKVNLYNIIINREEGLLEIVDDQGDNFSTGEKQRLNLSRLFIDKPDFILLDESTSNLDIYTENIIINEIKEFLSDRIVLAISHSNEFMGKFADKKITIN